MKIISAIGGSGSTFILRNLNQENYKPLFNKDTYNLKRTYINRKPLMPYLLMLYNLLLRILRCYSPKISVIARPDSFWYINVSNKKGIYQNPKIDNRKDLLKQIQFFYETSKRRAPIIHKLNLKYSKLKTDSINSLVASYLEELKRIERKKKYSIILLSSKWGEFGIFKELEVDTIYLIRDPYNSLISHSKAIRHQTLYLNRGFKSINSKEWIDSFLDGVNHSWINHTKYALKQKNKIIVRYSNFKNDWKKILDLPDITKNFIYRENKVTEILTQKSIEYIRSRTKELCNKLDLPIY